MAMLHPDDRPFHKSSPVSSTQITQLFASQFPEESINSVVSPTSVSGEYHKIYLIELVSGKSLILRVARPCIPHIKVENEVAVLAYLARHCPAVPVPRVWCWSAEASDNPLGFEYIVMDWISAPTLDGVWRNLPEDVIHELFDQTAHHWLALREISMGSMIGGLRFGRTSDGKIDEDVIEPGPVVEETFWQTPDIKRYWNDLGLHDETFSTLNIGGPFEDYRRYLQAHLRKYSHGISIHPALEFARHFLPRIASLVRNLDDDTIAYTRATIAVKVYFGHRDTHLGNILSEGNKIIAVIDWEFSGLRPSWDTNPTPWFLYLDKYHPPKPTDREQRPARDIWLSRFEAVVRSRAPEALHETEIPPDVKDVRDVWNWLRCICEVAPRGERMDLARGSWSDNLGKSLLALGL